MTQDRSATPNRIPWPPLLYGGGAVAGVLLGRLAPMPLLAGQAAAEIVGWGLLAIGLGFDLWAMAVMMRGRANIRPDRAATALVTGGPFALSRNPIYLGNTVLLVGAALAFGNGWLLVAAAGAAGLVGQLAILREEQHLNARFGAAWRDYAARTPRWIGWRR